MEPVLFRFQAIMHNSTFIKAGAQHIICEIRIVINFTNIRSLSYLIFTRRLKTAPDAEKSGRPF